MRTKTRSKLVVEQNGGSCVGESTISQNCMVVNCPGEKNKAICSESRIDRLDFLKTMISEI